MPVYVPLRAVLEVSEMQARGETIMIDDLKAKAQMWLDHVPRRKHRIECQAEERGSEEADTWFIQGYEAAIAEFKLLFPELLPSKTGE